MNRSFLFSVFVGACCVVLSGSRAATNGNVIFQDTFTEECITCTIELTTHKPDLGVAWLINEDSSGGTLQTLRWKTAGFRDWLSPMGESVRGRISYIAQPATSHGPDYAIRFTMDNIAEGSDKSFTYALIRRTASDTYYAAGWYHFKVANDCYLFKVVAGRYSQLANGDCNIHGDKDTGNNDVIAVSAVGDVLTLWQNGHAVLTARDSAITAAGEAGLGMGNVRSSEDTSDSSMAIDDLSVLTAPFDLTVPPVSSGSSIPPVSADPVLDSSSNVDPIPTVPLPVQAGDHGYFDSLRTRPEHWKSYSLRDAAQVKAYRQGTRTDVSYDPAGDTYVQRQDAAKVLIADFPWVGGATIAAPMSATDTSLVPGGGVKTAPNVAYKIDDEIMIYGAKQTTGAITVTRGAHGTTPAPHAAGAQVRIGSNSLLSQVRLPMGTENGHSYLTTWDVWYGSELQAARTGFGTWKTFQFGQGVDKGVLGLEVRNRFTVKGFVPGPDDVSMVDMRGYLSVGPEIAALDPISPMTGQFMIKARTWTRYWVQIEHVVGGWDRLSMWMADENRGPVQLLNRASFEAESSRFHDFWLEFNTSTDAVLPNRGPLVAYVRNVAMLKDVATPTALMLRPAAAGSLPLPAVQLSAPKNLRVVN